MSKRRSNKSVKRVMHDVFANCDYSNGVEMTERQYALALSWQSNIFGMFWVGYAGDPVVVSLTASELKELK